jgi:hypothetical protein
LDIQLDIRLLAPECNLSCVSNPYPEARKTLGAGDRGIVGLELIPTLEKLDLMSTKLTNVSQLAHCKALRSLTLTHCQNLTDDGIRGLELIPALEELSLMNTYVTNIATLSGCIRFEFAIAIACTSA